MSGEFFIANRFFLNFWFSLGRKRGPCDSSHDADPENNESQPSTKSLDLQYKMRPISLQHYLFLERLFLVVNENNGKPTYKYSLVRNQSQAFWSPSTI